ncbi:MAG: glycoside hydrolase family 130 protein [Acidobacteriia bacterium]|nr:glycoside hydrolase family 130 protein [Terriglobia bacterium]
MKRAFSLALAAAALACAAGAPARWGFGPFLRPEGVNPVIKPDDASVFLCPMRGAQVHWEVLHTFNPAAVVRNGKVYVLYRAEDNTGKMEIGGHTSRLGLAESGDGLHFTRRPAPVLYPADDSEKAREWEGGCEDPRIVESEDGGYVLTYTQWNHQSTDAAIATSRDLVTWTKHGPIFSRVPGGKYAALSYKSAGIVCRAKGGRLIAARIHGKYWMYWGEGAIRLATSTDLIDWRPVEDAAGEPIVVLSKRPGRFDSSFPEVGPPPVVTREGIVVLYNGKNAARDGDPNLPADTYAAGEALFAASDPARLIARTDGPIFKPELPFERSGQYTAGTTFTEGLVLFKGKYILYYGCADSLVGVALSSPRPPVR